MRVVLLSINGDETELVPRYFSSAVWRPPLLDVFGIAARHIQLEAAVSLPPNLLQDRRATSFARLRRARGRAPLFEAPTPVRRHVTLPPSCARSNYLRRRNGQPISTLATDG